MDKKECNHPSHLSEEEKYDIISEKVFNLIRGRALCAFKEYLDTDYKYHVANSVTPIINEMLFKRERQMQDFLNNNSIEAITKQINDSRQRLEQYISSADEEREKISKRTVTNIIEALEYYLEHECAEDYD